MSVAEEDDFLSRWSRRKSQARSQPGSQPAPQPPVPASPQVPVLASGEEPAPADAPPAPPSPAPLPPVESLTPQSDFAPFMAPEVDAQTRSQALKALFADPHFNTMDMMDVYVDDYSKPDPLPASWLEKLEQLSHLGDKAGRDREAAERARAEEEARAKEEAATATTGTQEKATSNAQAGEDEVAAPDTPIPPPRVGESET